MSKPLIVVWAMAASMSVPVVAHHGNAAFDTGKRVTLKGTVKQWVYSNPHLLLTLEVKGDERAPVLWLVETQAPNVMFPAGYRKDSFRPGDEVTIVAEPVKDGRPLGRIIQAVLANGWTLGFVNDAPIPPKDR
jgi:hypothetical protein